jgi:hypothetical protein
VITADTELAAVTRLGTVESRRRRQCGRQGHRAGAVGPRRAAGEGARGVAAGPGNPGVGAAPHACPVQRRDGQADPGQLTDEPSDGPRIARRGSGRRRCVPRCPRGARMTAA